MSEDGLYYVHPGLRWILIGLLSPLSLYWYQPLWFISIILMCCTWIIVLNIPKLALLFDIQPVRISALQQDLAISPTERIKYQVIVLRCQQVLLSISTPVLFDYYWYRINHQLHLLEWLLLLYCLVSMIMTCGTYTGNVVIHAMDLWKKWHPPSSARLFPETSPDTDLSALQV